MGTGIPNGGYDRTFKIGPAAADLIRIHPDDSWDLVVGERRNTQQGMKLPLSGLGAGFNDFFNGYIWRLAEHDGWLYAGTYNWSVFLPYLRTKRWPDRSRGLLAASGVNNAVAEHGGFDLASLLVTIVRWTAGSGTGTGTVPALPRFWLVAVLVGAGGFGLSFLLFNMVIVQVNAGRAAVVLNLIPVFGVASAVIFLGEGMTGRDALGAVLIGSSVLYFASTDHREATAQALRAEQDALRLLPVTVGAAHSRSETPTSSAGPG